LALFCSEVSFAQYAYFGTRGKISFDKITYTRARMRDMMSTMDSQRSPGGRGGMGMMGRDLENFPESSTQNFELFFDDNQTLMRNVEIEDQKTSVGGQVTGRMNSRNSRGGNFGGMPRPNMRNTNNQKVIYQDLKKSTSEIQVTIDETYVLSDSLDSITWRFTDEYRNIAGYECRRVNGSTKDSLYLIAFYTDQIPVSAGPALVHGLPGMVLGLVIPEMHIHYWATAVAYTNDPIPNNWKDKKATEMPLTEFSNSFGRYFQRGGDKDSFRRRVLEQLIY
jgi:GLPGLI family protein